MARPIKPKLHVVERVAWDAGHYEPHPVFYPENADGSHGVPVAAFAKKAAATKHAKALATAARAETNPFQYEGGEVDLLTSSDEESLIDRAIELGLVPPPPAAKGPRDWITWYDDLASQLTDAQRDGVWDMLDRLVLYAVVPVELEE